jgi:hypothetical protein
LPGCTPGRPAVEVAGHGPSQTIPAPLAAGAAGVAGVIGSPIATFVTSRASAAAEVKESMKLKAGAVVEAHEEQSSCGGAVPAVAAEDDSSVRSAGCSRLHRRLPWCRQPEPARKECTDRHTVRKDGIWDKLGVFAVSLVNYRLVSGSSGADKGQCGAGSTRQHRHRTSCHFLTTSTIANVRSQVVFEKKVLLTVVVFTCKL